MKGATKYFPSSTKVETMAILTALITVLNTPWPTFSQILNAPLTLSIASQMDNSPRCFQKVNNILWSLILHIVPYKNSTSKSC